jgi:hypothetical protein
MSARELLAQKANELDDIQITTLSYIFNLVDAFLINGKGIRELSNSCSQYPGNFKTASFRVDEYFKVSFDKEISTGDWYIRLDSREELHDDHIIRISDSYVMANLRG